MGNTGATMKILVCGGRNFADVKRTKPIVEDEPPDVQEALQQYRFVHQELNKIACKYSKYFVEDDNWLPSDLTIIANKARGVASAASDFAAVHYCPFIEVPIKKHDKLLELEPDLILAFPGTGRCNFGVVRKAKEQGFKVMEIPYETRKD